LIMKHNLIENIEFDLDKASEMYQALKSDYGIKDFLKVNQIIKDSAKYAIQKFKKNIPIWNEIKIVFVLRIGSGMLGRFRTGTSSGIPIIIMSESAILKAAEKYNVPLSLAVETTIYHELGHALCEVDFEQYENAHLKVDDEEEWVEEFSRNFYEWDEVPEDLERLVTSEYK